MPRGVGTSGRPQPSQRQSPTMFRVRVELAPPVRPLCSASGPRPAPSEGSALWVTADLLLSTRLSCRRRWRAPAGVCVSGRNAAVMGLCYADGQFISTLDGEVYKYVKSALIVFSKTGKESIFSDVSNTLLTGAVARGPESRPGRCSVQMSSRP